jgi:hypothetical protein
MTKLGKIFSKAKNPNQNKKISGLPKFFFLATKKAKNPENIGLVELKYCVIIKM